MPVELTNPSGLWLLAALGPLVMLYVLKIRREQRTVSSTWLWRAAERDLVARHPWRRLKPHVSLLLEALALIFLAAALAGPVTTSPVRAVDHVAIIVDVSASMEARTASGGTRFETARAAATGLLDGLAPGAEAMLITAGREPHLVAPLDRDRRRLSKALAGLKTRQEEGELETALALGVDRLGRLSGDRRVVVFTDHAVALPSAPAVAVERILVGEPTDNVGIVHLDVRRAANETGRERVEAFARIVNYGGVRAARYVTLRQRNAAEPLDSRRIELGPGERASVVLSFEPAASDAGTGLVVEQNPSDALAADDRAYGIVPPPLRLPVIVAPPDASVWVRRALEADATLEVTALAREELAQADLPSSALVVVEGACPAPVAGDLLVLAPPAGECLSATVGEPVERPRITSWKELDPRLEFLTLDDLSVRSARHIETRSPDAALVRAGPTTVLAGLEVAGRHVTIVSFDVGESDWPLKASFVLFLRNVTELARAARADAAAVAARTGLALRMRIPPGVGQIHLETPDGEEREVAATDGLLVAPAASQAGFYYATWSEPRPASVLASVSLLSERESDLRAGSPAAGARTAARERRAVLEQPTDWSWMLALFALLFVLADVWWLTRRPARVALGGAKPLRPEGVAT